MAFVRPGTAPVQAPRNYNNAGSPWLLGTVVVFPFLTAPHTASPVLPPPDRPAASSTGEPGGKIGTPPVPVLVYTG